MTSETETLIQTLTRSAAVIRDADDAATLRMAEGLEEARDHAARLKDDGVDQAERLRALLEAHAVYRAGGDLYAVPWMLLAIATRLEVEDVAQAATFRRIAQDQAEAIAQRAARIAAASH